MLVLITPNMASAEAPDDIVTYTLSASSSDGNNDGYTCTSTSEVTITGPQWLFQNVSGGSYTRNGSVVFSPTDSNGEKHSHYKFEYVYSQFSKPREAILEPNTTYSSSSRTEKPRCWNGGYDDSGSNSTLRGGDDNLSWNNLYLTYVGPAVLDTAKPVITAPDETISLDEAKSWTPMHSVTANDDTDGDLTPKVVANPATRPEAMTTTPGKYKFTYTVSDAAGNKATATRTITVTANSGTTIACPPTTGAPDGLSTIGFAAVGLGTLGLGVGVTRKRVF